MHKPILITGSHRSGTTWTGRVIALSNQIHYIHEPFNLDIKRRDIPLKHQFEYLNPLEKSSYNLLVKDYINSFTTIKGQLALHLQKRRNPLKTTKNLLDVFGNYLNKKRPLFKDPLAVMSAEWFHSVFDCDILILIRHPSAFVASIAMKNWQFDFSHFLSQDKLMEKHLGSFREIVELYTQEKQDIINQGILLWNAIYTVVLNYQRLYADYWMFVKHEDLSLSPIIEFEKIYYFLKLNYTQRIQNEIQLMTTSDKQEKLRRNSKENIKRWKTLLTDSEIERIKIGTFPLWANFYDESDW